jgi:hypothetical protein
MALKAEGSPDELTRKFEARKLRAEGGGGSEMKPPPSHARSAASTDESELQAKLQRRRTLQASGAVSFCFKKVSFLFQKGFIFVSKMFHFCFIFVSKMFHFCFKNVSFLLRFASLLFHFAVRGRLYSQRINILRGFFDERRAFYALSIGCSFCCSGMLI